VVISSLKEEISHNVRYSKKSHLLEKSKFSLKGRRRET